MTGVGDCVLSDDLPSKFPLYISFVSVDLLFYFYIARMMFTLHDHNNILPAALHCLFDYYENICITSSLVLVLNITPIHEVSTPLSVSILSILHLLCMYNTAFSLA